MLEVAIGLTVLVVLVMIVKTIKEPAKKQDIALEALSTIWTRHKNISISLEQIAKLWREQANTETAIHHESVSFQHSELQNFYDIYIKGKSVFINSGAYTVIEKIMKILDEEGDAPSVVNTDGEPEKHIDKDAYDVLSRISLVQHTVNVAREMCEMFKSSPLILPKAVIAAFGHDLGKLPSYRRKLYSMGDHPLMSVTILESIDGYKKLPYKDEISKAIKDHHRNPKEMLGEKLKEADQNARRYEISINLTRDENSQKDKKEQEPQTEYIGEHTQKDIKKEESEQYMENKDNGDISKGSEIFITQSEEEKERYTLQEVDLEWFNADEFLAELKPYINKLTGKRWQAFSMKDGYVYFQISVIEEVIKKLGRKYKDESVMMMDMDRGLKRNIIYTVVNLLKREKDAIARGLIKDGFIGGYFVVRMKDGHEYKAYYTPFNAEVFSEAVSELEILKVGRLKDIMEVYPKIENEEGV